MLKKFIMTAIVVIVVVASGFTYQNDALTQASNGNNELKNTYDPIVVLELFTSQGCSSCPSADRLLEEIKKRHPKNVFTLSYHVDYWNYIGWDDPFSNSEYAIKQRNYNRKLKVQGNYTPEVVVNGKSHFTGSNRVKMNSAILLYGAKETSNKVVILKHELKEGIVTFRYTLEGNLQDRNMRVILVLDDRTTKVKSGENRNRTIKNSNIVVTEKAIPLKETIGAGEIKVPNSVKKTDKVHLILLVENSTHDITAAAKETLGE